MNENRKPLISFLLGLLIGLAIAGIGVVFILQGLNKALRKRVLVMPSIDSSYQPSQPINFSHSIHSGEAQIDCAYCHKGASTSSTNFQTTPTTEVCGNCHGDNKIPAEFNQE